MAANSLGKAWRSFWHTMTSNDRHASHDSPYRTGHHLPLNQNRHAPLTSIATSATDSRPDLASPYEDEFSKQRSASANGWPVSPGSAHSPSRPYSPGMRSLSGKAPLVSEDEVVSPGEIQMQSFADGAPPAPPASHSWKKIDRWAEKHYEELYDQLGGGCTQNDINELEHELDCSLPQDVRDSLAIHDGQERGGRPTGIIFGCMLLDCEEIVQEWKNWKVVNEEYLTNRGQPQPQYPFKGLNGASSSTSSHSQNAGNKMWRQELLDRQDSQPAKAIQKAYAHPSWIPLARDWGGNNIAVDLAPAPMGKWGQVILFGRDYDCKYVIARSWAVFLSTVADDIESEKVFVDEESGEIKLREFKTQTVEPAYLDILRWRADQKYGQKRPKKTPLNLNTNLAGKSPRESPYNSPTVGNDDGGRGRSPQRFNRGLEASPRTQLGSPLARHHEEVIAPVPIRVGGDIVKDFASAPEVIKASRPEKLVDVPTPTVAVDENKPGFQPDTPKSERDQDRESKATASAEVDGSTEMRSVQI